MKKFNRRNLSVPEDKTANRRIIEANVDCIDEAKASLLYGSVELCKAQHWWRCLQVRAVLLVIDMQKHYAFANDEKIRLSLKAVECINLAIDLFRQKGLPIICI